MRQSPSHHLSFFNFSNPVFSAIYLLFLAVVCNSLFFTLPAPPSKTTQSSPVIITPPHTPFQNLPAPTSKSVSPVTTFQATPQTSPPPSPSPALPPFYIKVAKTHQVALIYGLDSQNQYTKLLKTFLVSTGRSGNTPLGFFKTRKLGVWNPLFGNVWGRYPIQFNGHFLFHSVPYYQPTNNQLEWEEYNQLGSPASMGCIRLAVADIKWLYDHIPNGTTVEIYEGALPPNVNKPAPLIIPASDPRRDWDPTDPDPSNPWRAQ